MLIKIIDNIILEELIPQLKAATSSGTASKAVAIAASNYIYNLGLIAEQSREIDRLKCDLNGIVSLLADKQGIQNHINEFLDQQMMIK